MLKAVILAAGKGTRMRSENSKVLFNVAGKPMIDYVIESSRNCGVDEIIVIVGNCAEKVMEHTKASDIKFAMQKEQKGTADAVKQALEYINDDDKILILCGDMPLIKSETLKEFIEKSEKNINFISTKTDNPTGYGRIVRSPNGDVIKIIEEKDANENEKNINEINTGVYFCVGKDLKERLLNVDSNNAQNEFYLTDIVKGGAFAYCCNNDTEFLGINDRLQLEVASKIMWKNRAKEFMKNGVSILDSDRFYCDDKVSIAKDTIIYPNVFVEGNVTIGENCKIYSGCRIKNSIIENNCEIRDNSLIDTSFIGANSNVGPMAHLRPETKLLGNNRIGNFVETKKTVLGLDSKASHLTYLGDSQIGNNVNIGCGTITCNYDGYNKYNTIIEDDVFVGSDVQLVAPVKIGKNVIIAAGTTVTKDVPENALAISRTLQSNKENLGLEIKERNKSIKEKNA